MGVSVVSKFISAVEVCKKEKLISSLYKLCGQHLQVAVKIEI